MVEAPKFRVFASVIATLFAPELVSVTTPPKSLAALLRVIAAPSEAISVVVPIVSAPV